MKFTDEQRKAVELLNSDLCVTSGAGGGKTRVLVGRYVHALERGAATVPEIAAITFTEKAALQMKERIRDACLEKMDEAGSSEEASRWETYSREIENARIGTIHGFCTGMLREFPVEIGVDPHFVVIDEGEAQVLTDRSIYERLVALIEGGDTAAIELVDEFGFERTMDMIGTLMSGEDIATTVARSLVDKTEDAVVADMRQFENELRKRDLDRLVSDRAWAEEIEVLSTHEAIAREDKRDQARQTVVTSAHDLQCESSLEKRLKALRAISGVTLRGGSAKNWRAEADIEAVTESIKRVRDMCKGCAAATEPDTDDVEQRAAHVSRLLAQTFLRCRDKYEELKRDRSALDFADLLTKSRDLLRDNETVREHYRKRLKCILVDEFQDTDPVQAEVIRYLTLDKDGRFTEKKLFVVGDAKQSIYKFRGADVSVFRKTENEILQTGSVVNLKETFRHRPEIVSFVNDFFRWLIGAENKQVLYDAEYADLVANRQPAPDRPHVEFLLVHHSDDASSLDELRKQEAELIARRIQHMVLGEEKLVCDRKDGTEEPRKVEYGDIAVLFRAMTGISTYEKAFREHDIPYYLTSGGGFYGRQEIKDIICFLKAVENANDEIALAGVLRSPMFGISDNTLYWLKRDQAPLFESIKAPDNRINDADREIVKDAASIIAELRDMKDRYSLSRLITEVVDKTGYLWVLRTMFLGNQRVSNVRKLIETARDLERRDIFTFRDFINYVNELVTQEIRESEAVIEEERSDVVKVTTIHKAKGLEYPVVFVADLAHGAGPTQGALVLVHRDGAVGLRLTNSTGGRDATAPYKLIADEEQAQDVAESKRLLYVACTRAKDHLVLSGVLTNKRPNSWITWFDEKYHLSDSRGEIAYGDKAYTMTVTTALRAVQQHTPTQSIAQRNRKALVEFAPIRDRVEQERAVAHTIFDRVKEIPRSLTRKKLFSVTELYDYGVCPRLYELKHVHDIPDKCLRDVSPRGTDRQGLSPSQRGIVAHRLFQLWNGDGQPEIRHLIERVLIEHRISDRSDRDEIERELLSMYERFMSRSLATTIRASTDIRSELRFSLNLDGAVIEGAIDKTFVDTESTRWVVDFKSDRIQPSEVREHAKQYTFQLHVYALALSQLTDGSIPRASIYFLTPAEEVGVTVDSASLERVRMTAAERISRIRADTFPLQQRTQCQFCTYNMLCDRSRKGERKPV